MSKEDDRRAEVERLIAEQEKRRQKEKVKDLIDKTEKKRRGE